MEDLSTGLADRHDVTVLISDWQYPHLRQCASANGRVHYRLRLLRPPASAFEVKATLAFPMRFALAVWRFTRFCRQRHIDIVHLHFLTPSYVIPVVARLLGAPPVVLTIHRGDVVNMDEKPFLWKWMKQFVARRANAVVAVSAWLAEYAQAALRLPSRPGVVYNGFSDEMARVDGPSCTPPIPEVPDRFAVMVANVRPYKGHDLALDAWRILQEQDVDLPLVIVGGGPGLESARTRAHTLGLGPDRVQFVGSLPRSIALDLVRKAALYVAPSRNEGFGIVVLEAGFLGVPVVCSDIGPFQEIVGDENNAFVFQSGDADHLAERVRQALNHPTDAARRAHLLQKRVTDTFSTRNMVRNYQDVYKAAVDD